MFSVNRGRVDRHRAVLRFSIDALRLVRGGAVNEHFISIEFEAAATKRLLAGLSTLVILSLSVHFVNGESR